MIYLFVVSFALGIVFEQIFHFGWGGGLFVLILSLTLFVFSFRSQENDSHEKEWLENYTQRDIYLAKIFLIAGIAFTIGVLRMNLTDVSLDPNLSKFVSQKISFEAVISKEPDVRDISVRYTVKPVLSKSQVMLIADRFPELKYGDKIKVSGKLDLPKISI